MIKLYVPGLLHFVMIATFFWSSLKFQTAFSQNIKKTFYYSMDTSYRIIQAPGNTYGYEILVKNKVLIRQQNIPGKPGTQGFKRKIDAEKVAQLVIKKLVQGIMPPTIDEKELIDLKIDYTTK